MSSSWVKRGTEAGAGAWRRDESRRGTHECVRYGLLLLLVSFTAFGQDQHVTWTLTAEPGKAAPGGKVLLHAAAKIEEGWHLYSMSTGGAQPTKIAVTGAAVDAVRAFQAKPTVAHDPNFNADTE